MTVCRHLIETMKMESGIYAQATLCLALEPLARYENDLKVSFLFQARGIDVQQVSLVINYDLPTNRENYIHR